MQKYNHILLMMAMRQEAQPVIDHYSLELQENILNKKLPCQLYQNASKNISLVLNGSCEKYLNYVCTQPAVLASYEAVNVLSPDLIINAGTAGAFQERGAKIGDVYLAKEALRYHDRRDPTEPTKDYVQGNYPVLEIPELVEKLNLKTGIVSTGNALDMTPEDLIQIQDNNADLKDMEAAAIGWVAELFSLPIISVKSVTDLVDNSVSVEEEFVKNLKLASENLKNKLINIIDELSA